MGQAQEVIMNLAQQPQPAKALLKDCYRAFGYLLKPLIPTLLMCIGLILVYVTAGFFLVSAVGEILHQPTLATILFYLYVAWLFRADSFLLRMRVIRMHAWNVSLFLHVCMWYVSR